MAKLKKVIIYLLLLLGIWVFLTLLTEAPAGFAEGLFCNEGKNLYCWTSIPYWECRSFGGPKCVDPPKTY
ncbi:MAG: hypothetical protein QXP04_05035 [Candidatus Nanoarchaeia archaeon]|nr:hypothetical protein [Candidatus Jingweiarchaeum tengchongense]